MPVDLKSQVRDYTDFFNADVVPVSVDEVKGIVGESSEPTISFPIRKRVPGWAVAVVAAGVVLLMVGGFALLRQTEELEPIEPTPTPTTIVEEPPPTSPPTTTLATTTTTDWVPSVHGSSLLTVDAVDYAGGRLVETADWLWALQRDEGAFSVTQIDKNTLDVVDVIIPDDRGGWPHLLADNESVWFVGESVVRIDADSGQPVETIEIPNPGGEPNRANRAMLAFDALWLLVHPSTLLRIDTATSEITVYPGEPSDPEEGWWLWAGAIGRVLWAYSPNGVIASFDTETETLEFFDLGFDETGVDWPLLTDTALWYGDWGISTRHRFDVTTKSVTDSIPDVGFALMGEGPPDGTSSAVVDGGIWWAYVAEEQITRIDVETRQISDKIEVGEQTDELRSDLFLNQVVVSDSGEKLWVTLGSRMAVVDVATRELISIVGFGNRIDYVLPSSDGVWVLLTDGTVTKVRRF